MTRRPTPSPAPGPTPAPRNATDARRSARVAPIARKALAASATACGLFAAMGFEQGAAILASGEAPPSGPGRAAFLVGMFLIPAAFTAFALAFAILAIITPDRGR